MNRDLQEALAVLQEIAEVAGTEGMDGETVIPIWPKDVAHDFSKLKVRHIEALLASKSEIERSYPAKPPVIRPPFQKALTVVMTKDNGDQQADADLAAVKGDSGTVFRVGASSLYFHHLRLRAALDPALLDKIAVFYIRPEDQVLQECGLRGEDELRWPVGFEHDIWVKETEIASVRHPREKLSPDGEAVKTADRLRAKYTEGK
jgi:hypothetical protein